MARLIRFSGKVATAVLAVTLLPVFAAHDVGAETFDARWNPAGPGGKSDRLTAADAPGKSSIVTYVDPQSRMTIVTKATVQPPRSSRNAPRPANEDARTGKKPTVPVGCEPFFSPVTTPSMANVVGRCVAESPAGNRLASLAPR